MTTSASPEGPEKATLSIPLSKQQRNFIVKLTFLIAGGMFIDGFVLGGIGVVMPAITRDLDLSLSWQGLIGASALIGMFIGAPLGGFLADKIGRRPMFTIDLAIFLVGSCAQFFVADAWQLFFVRLLMGVAIGADYAIGWPMLAEFAPARIRGKLLSISEVAWFVGYLVSYALGYVLTISRVANWEFILALSAIPTVIVILMRLGTPESPRWLMSKGRTSEAEDIAARYMDEEGQRDLRVPGVRCKQGFGPLFSRDYIKATVFISVFWFCAVTPYFAIGTFAPVVLQLLGLEDGLTGGLALNIMPVLACIFTAVYVERVGRRTLAIIPFWISTISLLILALFSHQSPMLIVACVLSFSFMIAVSGTLTGVYSSEVFPTEIRGAGVGFATAMSRIGAAAGTFLLPMSVGLLGAPTTLLIAAAISLIGGIVAQVLAPETMAKPLSQTSANSLGAKSSRDLHPAPVSNCDTSTQTTEVHG